MKFNIELLMQYVTYGLSAIGVLAFLVSIITQTIKELPILRKIQTNVVAMLASFMVCLMAVLIVCEYYKIVITWYYIFTSFVASFIVYLVATGGWEKVSNIWHRARYRKE